MEEIINYFGWTIVFPALFVAMILAHILSYFLKSEEVDSGEDVMKSRLDDIFINR